MSKYIRISNALYNEFEAAAKKEKECEFTYLENKDECNMKSKIVKFLNINGSEYMDVECGARIRLDKIVSFNGEDTKILNHY